MAKLSAIRDDQEIGLAIAGSASVDAASEDVALFLELVRLAADLESEQLQGEPRANAHTRNRRARSLEKRPVGMSTFLVSR